METEAESASKRARERQSKRRSLRARDKEGARERETKRERESKRESALAKERERQRGLYLSMKDTCECNIRAYSIVSCSIKNWRRLRKNNRRNLPSFFRNVTRKLKRLRRNARRKREQKQHCELLQSLSFISL
jgi:hypothetical protein